jgi:hypothetical protein
VQQNLQSTVINQPNITPNVLVTVDDGSGNIPAALVTAALTAVTGPRGAAAGISISVLAATKITANVNMSIVVAAGFVQATVVGAVQTAIAAYINGIGLGNTVSYFGVAAAALAVPGVVEVDSGSYTLNGGTADIVPTLQQTVKAGTVSVAA